MQNIFAADEIVADGKTFQGEVSKIYADKIVVDKKEIAYHTSLSVKMEAFAVHNFGYQLVLTNGSKVSGTIRKISKEKIVVMSQVFGLLEVPLSKVSQINFDKTNQNDFESKLADGEVVILYKNNSKVQGKILSSSFDKLVLRSEEGLVTLEFKQISVIWFKNHVNQQVLTLRNGDVLIEGIEFNGENMLLSFLDQQKDLSISNLKTIQLKK